MNKLRKRLTYANVMSSIAVFLVLGGGAAIAANQLAKNSVGTKQLKKNAVTTAKIKKNAVTSAKIKNGAVTTSKLGNGSVTGEKVNEATLGEVPKAATAAKATNAVHATTAAHATSAANASTVGGVSVRKFFAKIPSGGAVSTIFSGDGFSLRAGCEGGDTELTAVKTAGAPAMTATVAVFSTFTTEYGVEGYSNLTAADLDQEFPTLSGKLEMTNSAGTVTTIQYTAREPNNFVPSENVCVYGGTVISG